MFRRERRWEHSTYLWIRIRPHGVYFSLLNQDTPRRRITRRERMGTFHISMDSNQAAWRVFFPVESGYASQADNKERVHQSSPTREASSHIPEYSKKSVSHRPGDLFYHVSVPFILSVSVPPCDAGSIDRVKGKTAKQSGAKLSFDLPDLSFSSPEDPLFLIHSRDETRTIHRRDLSFSR